MLRISDPWAPIPLIKARKGKRFSLTARKIITAIPIRKIALLFSFTNGVSNFLILRNTSFKYHRKSTPPMPAAVLLNCCARYTYFGICPAASFRMPGSNCISDRNSAIKPSFNPEKYIIPCIPAGVSVRTAEKSDAGWNASHIPDIRSRSQNAATAQNTTANPVLKKSHRSFMIVFSSFMIPSPFLQTVCPLLSFPLDAFLLICIVS